MNITPAMKLWLHDHGIDTGKSDEDLRKAVAGFMVSGEMSKEVYTLLANGEYDRQISLASLKRKQEANDMPSKTTPQKMFEGVDNIDVKTPSTMYSDKKYSATHKRTKETMFFESGKEVTRTSELDYAKIGVLIKHLGVKAGISCQLTEHENELLTQTCLEDPWAGTYGGDYHKRIPGSTGVKALIDDAISLGLELAPIHFDEAIITTPSLHGEIYPFCDKREVDRGRRIEAASLSQVIVTSGGMDDAAVPLFGTGGWVTPLDTNITECTFACEVGIEWH